MASRLNVGIIGLGTMGRCIVSGLIESKKLSRNQIGFTTRQSGGKAAEELGLTACKDNLDLVSRCDTVILAVKPQNLAEVLTEIGPKVKPNQTLISIVASASTEALEGHLAGRVPVIRAMPNTPALVREGVTALCAGKYGKEEDWARASALFEPLGKVVRVDEKHMNAVTGLSGCGPAYVYVILESLTDAGIKVGLPRELSTQLAAQTVLGAVKMLMETGRHPAALKDDVTTPAGCTIDGLMELEEGKLRVTLIKAVVQATLRAATLSSV
ncbi:pyrroline-5-carboxylate reductase [bacterium]|nr:pyrroline-5-carboxylate reductase [bacterium]